MKTGTLWYREKKTWSEDIKCAASVHLHRIGKEPNMAYVHPSQFDDAKKDSPIPVKCAGHVLRDHVWVGVE